MEKKSSMEDVFRRSKSQGATANEKRGIDSVGDDHKEEIAIKIGEKRPYNDMNQSSAKQNQYLSCSKQDDQLETARAEISEVRQQNQRLKMYLDRIMKDYQTLQMQFVKIVQQEAQKKSTETSNDEQEIEEHHELLSLNLGRFSSSSDSKKNENNKSKSKACLVEEDLSLALDSKFEASKSDANDSDETNLSPAHILEELSKEEAGETMRSGDDEILQQSQVKKAGVSVRARCDTPTMNDGCQWRKYVQKITKGNSCLRAYYQCTVAPTCPIRKKVQRCVEDMSILITTYEGTHNHPLPVSATAMASTTSAAASMLLSGSSSSSSGTAPNNLHGLNSLSLSTSPLHSTITLDLTTPLITRFTSNYPLDPRYSSTNLHFSSSNQVHGAAAMAYLAMAVTLNPT